MYVAVMAALPVMSVRVTVDVAATAPPLHPSKNQSAKAGALATTTPPLGTRQLPAAQIAPGVEEVGVMLVPAGPPLSAIVTR
jgi:hypothetical protein